MISALRKAGKYLFNALLPRACLHCAADLHFLAEPPLCPACLKGLEPLERPFCARCGLPLRDGGASCRDCRGAGPGALAAARSALVFNPQLRSALHAFKYGDREDLSGFFADMMAGSLDRFPELEGHHFVLPVPLHRSRLRGRGYNQAGLLAAGLASRKGLFLLDGAAERTRDTPSQTKLTRGERRKNMQGAFFVPEPRLVKGRRLLIVDDVATTLSTLEELARELGKAGAASVAAYTLAREP